MTLDDLTPGLLVKDGRSRVLTVSTVHADRATFRVDAIAVDGNWTTPERTTVVTLDGLEIAGLAPASEATAATIAGLYDRATPAA